MNEKVKKSIEAVKRLNNFDYLKDRRMAKKGSNMTNYFKQYLETALWSSVDDDGEPLDRNYDFANIDTDSLKTQEAELEKFISEAEILVPNLLGEYDLTDIAHDFWLTRNRHGAGFWDGDYGDGIGDTLTKLSNGFGECNVIVGDDGKLYFEG